MTHPWLNQAVIPVLSDLLLLFVDALRKAQETGLTGEG
jgi:hypothetical protein